MDTNYHMYTLKVLSRCGNTPDDRTLYRMAGCDLPSGELFSHGWLVRRDVRILPRHNWPSYDTQLLAELL